MTDPAAARSGAAPQEEACSVCGNEERTAAGYLSCECPDPVATQWLRLYNLIANLAHPRDDHRENALEDEAHDLIRDLRAQFAALAAARLAVQQQMEQIVAACQAHGIVRLKDRPDKSGIARGIAMSAEAWNETRLALQARADAAEAAVTALRQDLQALIEKWEDNMRRYLGEEMQATMAHDDVKAHVRLREAQIYKQCARDLADRLARQLSEVRNDDEKNTK